MALAATFTLILSYAQSLVGLVEIIALGIIAYELWPTLAKWLRRPKICCKIDWTIDQDDLIFRANFQNLGRGMADSLRGTVWLVPPTISESAKGLIFDPDPYYGGTADQRGYPQTQSAKFTQFRSVTESVDLPPEPFSPDTRAELFRVSRGPTFLKITRPDWMILDDHGKPGQTTSYSFKRVIDRRITPDFTADLTIWITARAESGQEFSAWQFIIDCPGLGTAGHVSDIAERLSAFPIVRYSVTEQELDQLRLDAAARRTKLPWHKFKKK
jgi:hypothetical protein